LAALTLVGQMLVPHSGYLAVGLFYLFAVIILSLRVGRWPVLIAGILSALSWNYLFIPPIYTFAITKLEDGLMFAAYIVVALVAGQLTAKIRAQERNERMREERATALFHLTQALSAASSLDEGAFAALRQADTLFGARCALLLGDTDKNLTSHFASSYSLNEKERGVADWAWRNRKKAGRFTDTLPSAEGFHVPLLREDSSLGVFVVQVPQESSLTLFQRDLVESFAAQLALLVESEQFRDSREREKLLVKSEKLYHTLLDGVSHELKTPLAVLNASAESIQTADNATRVELAGEILTATRRLNRLVNNLLDQTRLESGTLKARLDWCDANDLVNAVVDDLRDSLGGHPFEVFVSQDMPLFRADFALMEHVLGNLLLNAAFHTPPGTPIMLSAGVDAGKQSVYFTVADRGPGLPEAMRGRLYKKFQRGDEAHAGGLGLGLSIVRGFVLAQGGEVVAGENPGGGALFSVSLPWKPSEPPPAE
jgi:two-component system sensor histidine kinase KdpD